MQSQGTQRHDHAFDAQVHARNYHYDYVTTLDDLIPESIQIDLRHRINGLIAAGGVRRVDHQGHGTAAVSDRGGRYLHHVLVGDDVRAHLPELVTLYQALLPLISVITNQHVVLSPHPRSDINIKVYPPGGGTLGEHHDTNGITVLLFLTTNREAPLRMQIPRRHPGRGTWVERREIHARSGTLLVMQGREVLHDCAPTETEQKMTVIFNYYVRGDTWRHPDFDDFVYDGIPPETAAPA